MLYSRERKGPLAVANRKSPKGCFSVCFGARQTLQAAKDVDGSRMARRNTLNLTRSTLLHRALSVLFLVSLLASKPAHSQSAKALDKRGQLAETREDYDAAYEDFRQAHLKKPNDLRYKTRYERLKFQAGAAHIERGRVLRQSGDLNGAMDEFVRAHEIDPSNQTAEQEIRQLQNLAPPPPGPTSLNEPAAPGQTDQVAPTDSSLSNLNSVAGPVTLQPVSNDPITIHTVEDVKNIYTAIGKLAGINVLFDPDYTSKRIPVDLTAVSLSDSLRIVGTIAGTFYKPITPNTIFVAQNTRTKRTDLDELAVQTFYLSNAAQQNDANEIFTALRNLLDPSAKLALIPTQNAFVLRATPDQLLLAQKLLNDLDRAKPEVVVDVAVLEVNRDKVRNLGITLPQSFGLTPTATTTTTSSSTGTTTGTSTGTTTTASGTTNLTLNQLSSLNASNFAVSVTGGTVNALLTDADTRILQNPRIRATDGQRATLKIGSKIPVATGSYNAGVATGVGSIGVQTQFTYLDIGVNIDMTPTVHYDREVSLKMKIEVSTHNGDQTISGVVEPIISQRVIEQVIQLKEGEPSILAGILSKQDTRGVNGTPGLGELPFLKYFFSAQNKETAQDEIVFLLIPHIVRESVLTRLNTRAIDTGTGQSIELRQDSSAGLNVPVIPRPRPTNGTTSAAVAASSMIGQLSQQAQMPTPGNPTPGFNNGVPNPATPPAQAAPLNPSTPANPAVPNTPISLSIVPPTSAQTVGSTFQIAVTATGAHDLYSVPLQLQFNPAVLQLVNVDSGDLLGRDGQAVAVVHRDEGNGLVTISASRPPSVAGVTGQGAVCVLTFKAIGAGDSNLSLPKVGAKDSRQASIPAVGSTAIVHVR